MLFTVSLQLTMTGHLSTSPSSISLACMLSGLCLLLSSLHFTDCFSPFLPSAVPPSPFSCSYHSYSAISVQPLPFCLYQAPSQFLMRYPSLPHCLSLAFFFVHCPILPLSPWSISFSYSTPLIPILPPSTLPSLTLSDSN